MKLINTNRKPTDMCRGATRGTEKSRGFTLIELMIVVVIIGILATAATVGYRNYINAAKTAEAREVIESISSAQEAYKDETFRYLNVTGDADSYYPGNDTVSGKVLVMWGGTTGCGAPCRNNFNTLGVRMTSPARFRYASTAALTGKIEGGTHASFYEVADPKRPWYLVKAVSDLNDSGVYSVFIKSSENTKIIEQRVED
jgi:type IV pilus assembly protein PilE